MEIFSTSLAKQEETGIFKLPVKNTLLPKAKITENRDRALYPHVTSFSLEEVDAHMDSGIVTPLVRGAEAKNQEKQAEVASGIIEDQPDFDVALAELEEIRNSNPILKQFVSPATLAALKQSDNPLARKVAYTKLSNVLIAVEVLESKVSESSEANIVDMAGAALPGVGMMSDNSPPVGDFIDSWVSDLPILSSINVAERKDLANRFVQILDSNADPSVIKSELESIVEEAADQGLFTQSNRFYMADFVALVTEGTTGSEAVFQETLGAMDALVGLPSILVDASRVLAFTRKGKGPVLAALTDAAKKDNVVSGHSTVVDLSESMQKSVLQTPVPRSPDEATAFMELNLETKAMQDARDVRLASGQSIDDDAFELFYKDFVVKKKADAEKNGIKRYVDTTLIVDEFENVVATEFFGTVKGRAYPTEIGAKNAAAKIGFGTEVVKASDGSGWLVAKKTNLPSGMFATGRSPEDIYKELSWYRTTDTGELGYGVLTKYIYSPLSQTTDNLNAILKQGESARAMAQVKLNKDYDKLLKSVGREGVQSVGKVIQDINQGSRAHLRAWPSLGQFDAAFFELNKRLPTAKERDLYVETVYRSDVNWMLSADNLFKREVAKGLEIFKVNELEVKGLFVEKEVFKDAKVWFEDAGKYVSVSDLPEDAKLVRLQEPQVFGGQAHDLVASRTPQSRALKHTDVLGYNPGGSRLYEPNQTNFMVKQDQELTLADGRKMAGRPTTIMAVKTQKEADKAVGKLNEVIETIHSKYPVSTFSKDEYLRLIASKHKDPDVNRVVAEVSDWNPNVSNVRTLVEFFEDMNLDLRKTVNWSEDGKPLVDGDTFVGDLTFRDIMSAPGVIKRGNIRRDKVLLGYGGQALPTVPAMEAIQRSFMSSVMRGTNAAYEAASINGLIKALIKGTGEGGQFRPLVAGQTLQDIRGLGLRQKLRQLDGKIFTNTVAGKKLELERQKILYRLESQNFLDAGYIKMKNQLANFLYDKDWKKTAGAIDAMSVEPFSAVRGIVFDAYLGMFNPAQLWVQASQIPNVVAMSEGLAGIRAVAAMPIVRKLIVNGHPAPTREMALKMSSILGVSPDQFISIVNELKSNGRVYVAASLADLGEDSAGKVAFRKFREAGRVFYNESELAARITAHLSSAFEYIKKNGKDVDLSTNKARKYISHSADKMTNAMTSTSRTGIEQLPMMQFMSYSMRMFEYLFGGILPGTKSVLTAKQKLKLGGMQLALYGVAGMPVAGYFLDWYNFKYGTALNEQTYDIVRNGAIDGILEWMTGVETEVGRRLAWGEGFFNTISDAATNSPVELLMGPSYSFGKDIIESFTNHRFSLETGNLRDLGMDVVQTARSIKSVNMAYNAWMAFKYGEYHNKRGSVIVDGLSNDEAAAVMFDVPLEKVNEVWRDIMLLKKDTEYYRSQAQKINSLNEDLNWEIEHNGWNTDRAKSLMAQKETIYALENMDPYDFRQIQRYIDSSFETIQEETILRVLRTDNARREELIQ